MAIKVLFFFTGTIFTPSAETNNGLPPPKVTQKEVDAPPSIIRKRTFSPAINSGYSTNCSPLIKNAG